MATRLQQSAGGVGNKAFGNQVSVKKDATVVVPKGDPRQEVNPCFDPNNICE